MLKLSLISLFVASLMACSNNDNLPASNNTTTINTNSTHIATETESPDQKQWGTGTWGQLTWQ